jgi:hypothetical protein
MAIYLDERTLDSELLDTDNTAVLAENFTYLVKQLMNYVNPAYKYTSVNKPLLKGGKRRAVRGERSTGLGYKYKTAVKNFTTTSKGTKQITAFGTKILVEEWTVSHNNVVDSDLGEEYPKADMVNGVAKPRGPYTCLLTARISLSKKTPTRCYIQCSCEDFKVTFYSKLNAEAYTNPQSLPAPTGKIPQAPAMCKHLYAIYSNHYRDLVKDTENFTVDPSPLLFQLGTATVSAPATPTVQNPKQQAIADITARLRAESNRLKGSEVPYLDSRGKAAGGGRHHLFMFYVVLLNGNLRAIAYRNRASADPAFANKSPIQLLNIPGNEKVWKLFGTHADHAMLWNLIRHNTQEMTQPLKTKVQKATGMGPYLESTEQPVTELNYLLSESSSSILLSMSELS